MARNREKITYAKWAWNRFRTVAGGAGLALIFFLILPFMQTISKPPATDTTVRDVDVADVAPPPPVQEQEKPPEAKKEDKPPELAETSPLLDLQQIELALNPSFGGGDGGAVGADFAVKLLTAAGVGGDNDALFSVTDLDQKPRAIYQPGPSITPEARKNAPGTVWIIFVVDKQGRVESPAVQKSDNSVFDGLALAAVRQWKFQPGQRNGEPVRFRLRVPITFPKGL